MSIQHLTIETPAVRVAFCLIVGLCGGSVVLASPADAAVDDASVVAGTSVAAAQEQSADTDARFVDEAECVRCHEPQVRAWSGSHHDLAMQPAGEKTVLGDFSDARFTHGGVTTRFFRRDGAFVVNTDGDDGALADFEVEHVFGIDPLQQLLIGLPGGRLQALSVAWDTREKRWFHLYPDERIDHRDELHWTKRLHNWNYMCGECHATGYRKGYDATADSYRTRAARMDVGCQACHGPASRHLDRVGKTSQSGRGDPPESGKTDFDVDLSASGSQSQLDTCGRCHSRRSTLRDVYDYGAPLLDSHLPALLNEGLYFADGQIDDEVYVYGSFLQSKMHAKGVRCSDCHEPHSGATRAVGNALCVTCHNAGGPAAGAHVDVSGLARRDYESVDHHHHERGRRGAGCVDCHAPASNYMVVDPRRDHSFRVPRPDLSARIGTPNACNGCHVERSAQWAAERIAKWFGPSRAGERDYAVAIDAGRRGKPGAVQGLLALTADSAQPAIVRATALDLLARYPGRTTLEALRRGLRDFDPLVRHSAITGYDLLAPQQRVEDLAALLDDRVLVRIAAARRLAPAASALPEGRKNAFESARRELEEVGRGNADTPEALTGLGDLYAGERASERAERLYAKAISLDAAFVPAYVNRADLLRALGREQAAETVLRKGLEAVPDSAALHGALGLVLVRTGRKDEALVELGAAARAAPEDARHVYVYAVALHGAGRAQEAIDLLDAFSARRGDRDVLLALASFKNEAGDSGGAAECLRTLAAINPGDPA